MPVARWTELAKVSYPLSVLADNYIAYLKGNGRSPHTIEGFTRVLRSFQQFVAESGEKGTKEDLCPEVVVGYRAHLVGKKYALSSVRVHIQVLKAWSAYLTEERVFRSDPLARRGLLPKIPKPLPKFLTDEDRTKVMAHLTQPDPTSARNLAIFCLLLDTGLRVSELAALKVADVDFRRNETRVWGKGAKERRVGFGNRTARYLRGYVDFHRSRVDTHGVSEGYLFLCHTGHGRDGRETIGEPLSTHGVKLVFRRLSEKLGVELHPHKLRHTFSTDFLNNGGSVADLQRLLGHETPQMSLYYAHITNTDAVERQKTNSVVDRQLRRAK
ncbi:MAG: tyrosine-type recombinase/integrase [Chloroflexi bacterium]|nr:tyrosine-type recombinase/integrase [Chloroflexota bacterium]